MGVVATAKPARLATAKMSLVSKIMIVNYRVLENWSRVFSLSDGREEETE